MLKNFHFFSCYRLRVFLIIDNFFFFKLMIYQNLMAVENSEILIFQKKGFFQLFCILKAFFDELKKIKIA